MICRLLSVATSLVLIVGLGGCATDTASSFNTTSLKDLQNMTLQNTSSSGPMVSKIRENALKDTALSIGAQGGLALRAKEIDKMLTANTDYLNQVYDFSGLMLDHHVMPPVLQQSKQSLSLNNPDLIVASDHTYKIVKQAHFVTAPPTWRDYLYLNYKKPSMPDSTLLPKNGQERNLWVKYVNIGWEHGIDQANTIYKNGLASLQRDYQGMMLYRRLLSQHIVSKPYVAQSDLGITSNGDNTEMNVNSRLLRITSVPTLQPNSKQWKPVMVKK